MAELPPETMAALDKERQEYPLIEENETVDLEIFERMVAFAREHGLKVGRIADLIRYRLQKEESVERISEQSIETEFGEFRMVCFEDHVHQNVHLALVKGEPGDVTRSGPLVRVQLLDTLRDVVGIQSPESGWHLAS